MIKECNVILHNSLVAVVVFDGKKIQVPSNKLIGKTAYVKYEKEKYIIISKEEYLKSLEKKQKTNKKQDVEKEKIVIDKEENIE